MILQEMLFHIALHSGRYNDPRSLARCQSRVYSQNGEDGVIAEIFQRLGSGNRFFVEIGTGNGLENNTRLLLEQGWRGLWVDGSESNVNQARQTFSVPIKDGSLRIIQANAAVDNIVELLAETPEIIDFMSLDIDQNTSHIWRSMTRPCRVACLEYNASIPPSAAIEAAYDPAVVWTEHGTNWYGASLKALELIGREKNMHLVGCELLGVNAFFVSANEAGDHFQTPYTAEFHFEPPRYYAIPHWGWRPAGAMRKWMVDGLPTPGSEP